MACRFFPSQGSTPHPLQWKQRVLTTGPQGKSPERELVYWSLLTLAAEPGPRVFLPTALSTCRDLMAGRAHSAVLWPAVCCFPPRLLCFQAGETEPAPGRKWSQTALTPVPTPCASPLGEPQVFSPGFFLGGFALESLSQGLLGKSRLRHSVGVFCCCHRSVKKVRERQWLHTFGC